MAQYTLSYFDFPGGRGEDCRLAFYLHGVEFEDDRIAPPQWAARRDEFPCGALPVLRVEGQGVIPQSNAILTFIGRTTGSHPSDPFEAARHEAMMGAVEDFRKRMDPTLFAPDEVKKSLREKIVAEFLPGWASYVAGEIRGPFVAGDRPHVIDLKLFVFLKGYFGGTVDYIPGSVFDPYPVLRRLHDNIGGQDKIQAWYSKWAPAR